MQPKKGRRIFVALDLTHASGRAHLNGFYRYADKQPEWDVRLVPSTEESYVNMVKEIVGSGIDGAIIKGECVQTIAETVFAAHVPVVSIDRPHSETPFKANTYVVNDNERIGLAAAKHFKRLGKFASYGYVPDPNDCEWSRIRGKAFFEAVANMLGEDDMRMYSPPPHCSAGETTFRAGLAKWLAEMQKPAAVFAAFDQSAAIVLEECREIRLKVPAEVAVLGVDDDSLLCEHTRPKLTSVRPNHEYQGFAAAKELHWLISHKRTGGPPRRPDIVVQHIGITDRDSMTYVPQGMRIVREINAYLNEYSLTPIRVSDIVAHARVSERLANRRYTQLTGHSIQEELLSRRLAEAKRLLDETPMSMSRIADRCGFKSQVVLAHLFRRRFKMSMSDWRNRQTG